MKSNPFIGYLVIDDGRPVRNFGSVTRPFFHPGANCSSTPISIFLTLKRARRVKGLVRRLHRQQANRFDPKKSAEEKRCFEIYRDRANTVHIRRAVSDALETR
jgi:hypothetical protein